MNTQEVSSSSSSTPRWNHDVFLSFRGEDTRKNFTGHLYTALVDAGIHTFIDDDELPRGRDISLELLKAIQESRISIVVFSKNYGSSGWCLDELVRILECKKTTGQLVLPIFFNVNPSDVRKQTGSFAEAFAGHEEHFKAQMEKVEKWRAALTEAANLSGWDLQNVANGHESKFIKKIVEEILCKVNHTCLNVAMYPIGIDSRVEDMNSLLRDAPLAVRFVGIHGMGGIGKTTIAKAVYKLIRHEFEASSFLANVREVSEQPNGLVHLQEQLLYDILIKKNMKISNVDRGINVIKERLCCKRVLVVLDDVDQLNQLNALAGKRDWFGLGSRIIITTRDVQLLNALEVHEIYKPKELNDGESLQLFSWHAFKRNSPIEDYVELSNGMVSHVGGLPLALEVVGSFLFDKRRIPEWKSAFEKLKRIPHNQVQKKLKISFDGLDDKEKDIFLDIVCVFHGIDKDYVIKILDDCISFPEIGISVLSRKALVTIDENNKLRVHDQLRDMGREIVREESLKKPGKRSRIWFREDVCDVLAKHMGTKSVEALVLNLPKLNEVCFSTDAFTKMNKLRLLQINYVHLTGDYDQLSKELRWLCWHGCPLKCIPSKFNLDNLVALDLRFSRIKNIWKDKKVLKNLRVLNLSYSDSLTKTPNFFGLPRLESLMLDGCGNLVEIHESIGHADRLVFLNLKDCKNLKSLPSSICNLKYLENLILSGCSKLDTLPEHLGNMTCLTELLADGIAIKQLPISIGLLKNLRRLSLRGCTGSPSKSWHSFLTSLVSQRKVPINLLPASISSLLSLRRLQLCGCNLSEGVIPSDFGRLSSLKELYLCRNNFSSLQTSISRLSQLRNLSLNRCTKLQSIPEIPSSLKILHANHCTSMERLSISSNSESLRHLFHVDCNKLVEIQGLDKSKSLTIIHMESRDYSHNLANTFKNSLLQGLLERTSLAVHLLGNEVLEWCNYQSIGSSISFNVPSHSDCKIRGLTVCAVYAAEVGNHLPFSPCVVIKNKTNGLDLCHWPGGLYRPVTCQDHLWVTHIPQFLFKTSIKGGDQVEVSIEVGQRIEVKRCGVLLQIMQLNDKSNDAAMIRCTALSSNENWLVDDGDVDKSVNYSGAKRYRDDDEVKPSSSGCCIQDPNPKRLRTNIKL